MTETIRPESAERLDSAADERTRNNVMRHEYRVLTEDEKAQMKRVKDLGLEFVTTLQRIGGVPGVRWQPSRELQIAQERAEEAVMWAVKHITK